ncbi:MAG: hypothetical protein V5A79_06970, partial [Candidatus Bipolaricaulota bacterium]
MVKFFRFKAFPLLLTISLVLVFTFSSFTADIETRGVKRRIKALLPDNSMLRDCEHLPSTEKFLVIYIVDPKIEKYEPNRSYSTCPPLVHGQPIRGEYHLALYEEGYFVNDTTIPRVSSRKLKLVYRQT